MSGLQYLASPYSHADVAVKRERYRQACVAAGRLMKRGVRVFSPIAHSVAIEEHFEGRSIEQHDFWLNQDFAVLRHCEKLLVLRLDGWEISKGVAAEVEFAGRLGIPVFYIDP